MSIGDQINRLRPDDMPASEKKCLNCEALFSKRSKDSANQWNAKKYCSTACKAEGQSLTKNPIPGDTKFGRLLFLGVGSRRIYKSGTRSTWMMVCECGNRIDVDSTRVRRGMTKSCGCIQKETAARTCFRHGYSNTAEWRILMGAIKRCSNENEKCYPRYGGAGIKVCKEWCDNPALFIEYIGPRPSPQHQLDRINSAGNYEPGNVRWATTKVQCRNRRVVHLVRHNGTELSAKEYCEEVGLSYSTYQRRHLELGWSKDDALSLRDGRRDSIKRKI